ncbi:MAG: hypothetical protein BGO67_02950 [Alphaproteobacteria bacterium 41-28]|nr:MAG: hypothetical protein BGO67_02950 [Alphaproteobacteria bacterium 41-28]
MSKLFFLITSVSGILFLSLPVLGMEEGPGTSKNTPAKKKFGLFRKKNSLKNKPSSSNPGSKKASSTPKTQTTSPRQIPEAPPVLRDRSPSSPPAFPVPSPAKPSPKAPPEELNPKPMGKASRPLPPKPQPSTQQRKWAPPPVTEKDKKVLRERVERVEERSELRASFTDPLKSNEIWSAMTAEKVPSKRTGKLKYKAVEIRPGMLLSLKFPTDDTGNMLSDIQKAISNKEFLDVFLSGTYSLEDKPLEEGKDFINNFLNVCPIGKNADPRISAVVCEDQGPHRGETVDDHENSRGKMLRFQLKVNGQDLLYPQVHGVPYEMLKAKVTFSVTLKKEKSIGN